VLDTIDPYAFTLRPAGNRLETVRPLGLRVGGRQVDAGRSERLVYGSPLNIYEITGLLAKNGGADIPTTGFRRAHPYLKELGYTHVELCRSWSTPSTLLATSAPAICAHCATGPEGLMAFDDRMHGAGLGVIIVWCRALPWTGTPCASTTVPTSTSTPTRQDGAHGWQTRVFDYAGRRCAAFSTPRRTLAWRVPREGLRGRRGLHALPRLHRGVGQWRPNIYAAGELEASVSAHPQIQILSNHGRAMTPRRARLADGALPRTWASGLQLRENGLMNDTATTSTRPVLQAV
jgi:hypothetical protein